jgi:uncharacterized protein YcbK (DUF882 family)
MSSARRLFLRMLAASSAGVLAAPASLLADARSERQLSFLNTHTGERLTAPYFADGAYLPSGLAQFNRILRDHRTGEQYRIDPALYDLLHDLKLATATAAPFQIISGFRSSKTNAALRAGGHGVATRSLHLDGKAVDVRLSDVRLSVLRDAALELRRGGVGYYAGPDFVHVDTGRVRQW